MLIMEIAERSHQLRQMRGDDLQGLNVEELQQLEKFVEVGLSRVIEKKVKGLLEKSVTFKERYPRVEDKLPVTRRTSLRKVTRRSQ
ncbi:hypothetical protein F3Y22_tig00113726pilonHSYRG00162 [Hibiscus syriacus]|uniref:K-box domain-containing protein n=1 Tax=Hibiscus syriacus TaxID=106335 RepID=A0A6A2WMG4_HIBSY|nr:hypothetical protein F3Y22_tig00113726pilonHSYRG00162 [Hibiscus syriacus]